MSTLERRGVSPLPLGEGIKNCVWEGFLRVLS